MARPDTAHPVLLPVARPFAADVLLEFLALRAIPGVEAVDGGVYRRTLRLRHGHGAVELQPASGHVRCLAHVADPRDRDDAVRRCRALLDLDARPADVDARLGSDGLLAPLVAATPGLRVPGAAEPEEIVTRAVLGQQISVTGARTLAGRLAEAHGDELDLGPDAGVPDRVPRRLFPAPAVLAGIDPATLAMPAARARSLVAANAALADGSVALRQDADPAAVREALEGLPGIGPWTAAYVAMRALGARDTFLPTDLAVRRGLRALGASDDPDTIVHHAEAWRPYRAYAVLHLWNAS